MLQPHEHQSMINAQNNIDEEDIEEIGNGPMTERSMTDIVFCILMLLFWCFTTFLFIYGFSQGNPWKLIQAYNKDGIPCNDSSKGTKNYKYAFIYQPLDGDLKNTVCVMKCPTWETEAERIKQLDCFRDLNVEEADKLCKYDGDFNFEISDVNLPKYKEEPFLIYDTVSVFGRFCIVKGKSFTDTAKKVVESIFNVAQLSNIAEEVIADIGDSWTYLIYVSLISMVLSIIALVLIRYLAGFFTWLLLLLYLVACFGLAVAAGYESDRLSEQAAIEGEESGSFYSSGNLKAISILLYIIGGISVIFIMFALPSIILSIAIIKTSGQFITNNLAIIFIPIAISVFNIGYVILWVFGLVYLISVGEIEQQSNSPINNIKWSETTKAFVYIHAFSVLWNAAFINYLGIFIIGCAAAIWYFNRRDDGGNYFHSPIRTSIYWAFRYHLGSLSFGALILAIVWLIQICLAFIVNYVNKLKNKGIDSRIINVFIKCLLCFVSCFERIVQFISKLGFIQVAVTSKNFCTSCIKAGSLLLTNPMKFGFVTAMGEVFVFIGKLFVAAAAGAIGYLLLAQNEELSEKLYSSVVPTLLFIAIGWLIAMIFFSTYGIAADAILLCFFWSREDNKKTGRPINPPAPMSNFYEKYKRE